MILVFYMRPLGNFVCTCKCSSGAPVRLGWKFQIVRAFFNGWLLRRPGVQRLCPRRYLRPTR
eukprot:4693769-Pyramimonas_sp.AAC.1